ncbi:hypothetical protein J2W98_002338 [Paenibacillus peoriae]|uniref:Uncharacterized protein n=1 Tax=Paenibacillus peoriae TaxID=59893 RepID=A0ABU1QEL0_9BACL|nr:hypothetical protein [Paenibacillus peoriae]SFQ99046.1 hypothetical protein SAMN04488603_101546 [Paenibacillus sp. cl130]
MEQDTVVSEDFGFLIDYGIVKRSIIQPIYLILGVDVKKDLEDCRPQDLSICLFY